MPDRWCAVAELRKSQIESGLDITFSHVMEPYFLSLAEKLNPAYILEVGAGTGHLAKSLCKYGDIDALEPSSEMYSVARSILQNKSIALYHTDLQSFKSDKRYELIISNMCIQTIESFEGLLGHVHNRLSEAGTFTFTIPHPCFYNDYKGFFTEEDFVYMDNKFKEVSFHISLDPDNEISSVPYYHRPLSYYIGAINDCGFIVSKFDEIFPNDDVHKKYNLQWSRPRYCAFQIKRRP